MTRQGVILYGPPTSGKDTITAELARQDDRFALVAKLKAGSGRTAGYRPVCIEDLTTLREAGRLVVETERYGNRYAVDRQDVEDLTASGRVPVVHMGNLADLERLRAAIPLEWTAVLLWIPREVCAERSGRRGDADSPERLRAWDETSADLDAVSGPSPFDLTVHTDQAEPAEAARQIIEAVKP
ncbi:guanylate kinase [Spirillospora sp. NPDC029432]|uniref:guanylate kinase n=1 Tax=Spirillospora sp. NPDC029432 TaxID=3154599 RepID=UPI0034573721